MYIAMMITVGFFAVIGVAVFLSALLRCGEQDVDSELVLRNLTAENAEARVRSAASACEKLRCPKLICICSELEAERICALLKKEYGVIEISIQ